MSVSNIFGPYTPVMRSGDTYYISGQVGVDPQTKEAALDIQKQTSQAMCNMKDALAQHGLGTDNVVKTTIYVIDMGDFEKVNEVYQGFFAEPRPARATVAVKELPRVADNPILVEIEAIASVRKRTDQENQS